MQTYLPHHSIRHSPFHLYSDPYLVVQPLPRSVSSPAQSSPAQLSTGISAKHHNPIAISINPPTQDRGKKNPLPSQQPHPPLSSSSPAPPHSTAYSPVSSSPIPILTPTPASSSSYCSALTPVAVRAGALHRLGEEEARARRLAAAAERRYLPVEVEGRQTRMEEAVVLRLLHEIRFLPSSCSFCSGVQCCWLWERWRRSLSRNLSGLSRGPSAHSRDGFPDSVQWHFN